VIAEPVVNVVYWGNDVAGGEQSVAPGFYSTLLDSEVIDGLDEYDAPFHAAIIDRGYVLSVEAITPSNTNSAISDGDIQNELTHQFEIGGLPPPGADQIFAIHLPPNVSVGSSPSGPSCAPGGFCGYHNSYTISTIKYGDVPVIYTVIPDFSSSACASGCYGGNWPDNFTGTASHEILEVITDPDGSGWYPEIGDPCNNKSFYIFTQQGDGFPIAEYAVSKHWSNAKQKCVDTGTEFQAFTGTLPANTCSAGFAVSRYSAVWSMNCDYDSSLHGNSVEVLADGSWSPRPGRITQITMAPNGVPWALNDEGKIFYFDGSHFSSAGLPPGGRATAIAVGWPVQFASGDPWIIGTGGGGPGGNGVYHLEPTSTGAFEWYPIPYAGAVQIAVSIDTPNTPWLVANDGSIWKWNGNSFTEIPQGGCANTYASSSTIAVGKWNEAWIIGCGSAIGTGGFPIYHLTASGWEEVPGAAVGITLSPEGKPWVLSDLFRSVIWE
jgi:hypothetical protein